jgi:tRNA(adenine34) deaminase
MYTDEDWMRLAIAEARRGLRQPGGAEVGCVIVKDRALVQASHNEVELRHDPTAHAEMVGIRELCSKTHACNLKGCTLYCTLQPCGMCSLACIWAGISRIVYGATRENVNSVYFETRHADTADFIRECFRNDLEICSGVLEMECSSLYARPDESAEDKRTPAHQPTE